MNREHSRPYLLVSPVIVADVPRNSTQREILNPAAGSRTGFDGD
jgi:hypothetical protein